MKNIINPAAVHPNPMVNHGQRVAHLQEVAEIHVEPPEVVEAPAQAGLFFFCIEPSQLKRMCF